ncbi:hypothetical protein PWO95_06680 [Weissella paramesenteroides]|nr:hypothetical protein [Weissella paramesenteroides]WEA52321.1 hypothetical protein PWO95_06680 [Weissella paramesenteroides]
MMVTMKDLNKFANDHGYRDWNELKTYGEPEIVQDARKMIERGY